MEKYRGGSLEEKAHTQQDLHFAPCRMERARLLQLLHPPCAWGCQEPPLAPTETGHEFLGETSPVLLGRIEKRDSGGWQGLFQLRAEQRALGQPRAAPPAPFHVPTLVPAAEQPPALSRARWSSPRARGLAPSPSCLPWNHHRDDVHALRSLFLSPSPCWPHIPCATSPPEPGLR